VNHDWASILAENGPLVWRTAYRVLNNSADAQDCFQDTFPSAWQFARDRRVTAWAPFLTWLATHKAIDRLRQRVRQKARTEELEVAQEAIARPHDPLQSLRLSEALDCLRTALANLPAKQAEVVWLHGVEGLTYQQISEQLGVSRGEVRVLLHRARAQLRDRLAAELTD
jgi:RNA polymerase sigma-70 factor, ECF subfamily